MLKGDAFAALPGELLQLAAELEGGAARTRVAELETIALVPAEGRHGAVTVEDGNDVVLVAGEGRGRRFRVRQAVGSRAGELARALAPPAVDEWLLEGFNVAVIGVGPSGAGKTRALRGSAARGEEGDEEEQGSVLWAVLQRLLASSKGEALQVGLKVWHVDSEDTRHDLLSGVVRVESLAEARAAIRSASAARAMESRGPAHIFVRVLVRHIKGRWTSHLTVADLTSAGRPGLREETMRDALVRQWRAVDELVTAVARKEITQELRQLPEMQDSVLAAQLAPLLASGHKSYLVVALSAQTEDWRANQTALRLATRAGLITTACLRADSATDECVPRFVPLAEALRERARDPPAPFVPAPTALDERPSPASPCPPRTSSRPAAPTAAAPEARRRQNTVRAQAVLDAQEQQAEAALLDEEAQAERQLERELAEVEERFQRQASAIQTENQRLQARCEALESKSVEAGLLRLHEEGRDRAEARKLKAELSCSKVEAALSFPQGDPIEVARAHIRSTRKEIAALESELQPLRRKRGQFRKRAKFLERVEEQVAAEQRKAAAAETELEQRKGALNTLASHVQTLESRSSALEQRKENLEADRKATSAEVLRIRKYLSRVDSEDERAEVLRELECGQPERGRLFPRGAGLSEPLLGMFTRLEALAAQQAPAALVSVQRARTLAERMGVQLLQSQYRERQLSRGVEESFCPRRPTS